MVHSCQTDWILFSVHPFLTRLHIHVCVCSMPSESTCIDSRNHHHNQDTCLGTGRRGCTHTRRRLDSANQPVCHLLFQIVLFTKSKCMHCWPHGNYLSKPRLNLSPETSLKTEKSLPFLKLPLHEDKRKKTS